MFRAGFYLETLIAAAPASTETFFYRTSAGAELDRVLRLPGGETWAIEIKRTTAPKVSRGFHLAIADIKLIGASWSMPESVRFPSERVCAPCHLMWRWSNCGTNLRPSSRSEAESKLLTLAVDALRIESAPRTGPFNSLGCITCRTEFYSLRTAAVEKHTALEDQY
jgi:hypothetical protein